MIGVDIVLIGPVGIFLLPILGFELGTSRYLILHTTTMPWWFVVFSSVNFMYLILVQRNLWWYCSDWTCGNPVPGFEVWTTGSLVLHSNTVPQLHLVFTSDNWRYLSLVQRDLKLYCSDWTCEDFSFAHNGIWTWDLLISNSALYFCAMANSGFHLWQFQVFYFSAEGLVVALVWLNPWEFSSVHTMVLTRNLSISRPHSTTVPCWLLVLTSDNFRQ